mmetsp:Transcript_4358/g.9847  ORF Transcript_4358/g.9847 Transcript_4358/m.9847 type:complete len:453 (-) Transcript_4358:326-1684(-)
MIGLSETKRRFLDKMTHQILKPRNIPLSLQQVLTRRFETLDKKHPFYATRCQALTYLQEQGLPTLTEEDYKYTPITSLLTTHFDFGRSATPEETFPEATIPVYYHDLDAYSIVLLHGQVRNQYTSLQDCGQLMQILTFQEAYQQQQHAFLQHFAQHAPCKTDAFTDLNTALFEEGLFIRIADHAIVEKPLVLYHCTTAHAYQPITYPRILIVIGKNSQASIVMSWQTAGFTNAVTEVVLQESSRLDYYNLQTELDQKNYQVNTTQCQQAKQSTLNTYTFTWSGAMVRNKVHSKLNAPYSETNLYGFYYLREQQHVDHCTVVDHQKPHTHSNELYKGIIMDASTGVFNGKIYVKPEAQKTTALQTNNNLVLSNRATLHTKPQLEIWADDVKCSHGATLGQLNAEQLFYLRARGLSETKANALLRQAFANEVLDKVSVPSLKMQLCDHLAAQIN